MQVAAGAAAGAAADCEVLYVVAWADGKIIFFLDQPASLQQRPEAAGAARRAAPLLVGPPCPSRQPFLQELDATLIEVTNS